MVSDHRSKEGSQWAAMASIDAGIVCNAETPRAAPACRNSGISSLWSATTPLQVIPVCCRSWSEALAALADMEHGRAVGQVILQSG